MPNTSKVSDLYSKVHFLERLLPILIFVLVGLAFLVGILWEKVNKIGSGTPVTTTSGQIDNTRPPLIEKLSQDKASKIPVVTNKDHVLGSRTAKVFLIEYTDFECPYCKQFHPVAQKIFDDYKGQVAWVLRDFPIELLHSKARSEAEAIECAAEIGGEEGYWKLASKVFEVTPSNNGLNVDDIPKLASQVGLNETKFRSCVSANTYKDQVESDYQGGVAAGVEGTPGSFVVNSKGEAWVIRGAASYNELKQKAIEEALKG